MATYSLLVAPGSLPEMTATEGDPGQPTKGLMLWLVILSPSADFQSLVIGLSCKIEPVFIDSYQAEQV